MGNVNLIITLVVLAGMIVMFAWNKVRYGLVAMTAVVILALARVVDFKTAFSGLSDKVTVLVAAMLVIAGALGQTSLAERVRSKMESVSGKRSYLVVLMVFAFTFLLRMTVSTTAVMVIMFVFVQTLDDKATASPARMIFVACAINAAWFGRIPFGMNTALVPMANGFYQGLAKGHPDYMLGMFDLFKAGLIPAIALTIYTLLAWRLLPTQPTNSTLVESTANGATATLSRRNETIVFIVFAITMIGFLFSEQLGDYMYLIPVAAVLVLFYLRVLTIDAILKTLTSDMVWMVAGMTVISTALSTSGAGKAIGNAVMAVLGHHANPFLVAVVFCFATLIPANFTSQIGTMAIMTPIAASTAISAGMNPKAIVLIVMLAACSGIAFPSGNAAPMLAFGIGNFNPVTALRFTLPYLLVALLSISFTVPLLFPIYH